MKYWFCFFLLFVIKLSFSQDANFSQSYANPLYLSPSFCGTTADTRISASTRDQWASFPGNFITNTFSFDHNFENLNTGVGFLLVYDSEGGGIFKSASSGLMYSYKLQLNKTWKFKPGINLKFVRRWSDITGLFSSQDIALRHGQYQALGSISDIGLGSINYIDAALSSLFFSKKEWFGFTIDHLFKPDVSFGSEKNRIPFKYIIFGGKQLFINYQDSKLKEKITGTFVLNYQGANTLMDLGAYYLRAPFTLGLHYRGIPRKYMQPDALIFL